ncbi:MAG TPA: cupredoxin domain-containing protein [Dehalococcoidia bacterium]|nr:cupredoxin domain-containing protein [Dehalococcoidia bacterium]
MMSENRLKDVFESRLSRRRLVGSTGMAALASAFLAACGGGDDDDGGGGGGSSGGGSSGGDGGEADITVRIVGQSPFHFEPDAIELKAGVEVTLDFINESGLPHSFRINGLVDSGVIKNPGSDAKSSDSSIRLKFTPTEPGETIFYCTAHGPQSESGKVTIT